MLCIECDNGFGWSTHKWLFMSRVAVAHLQCQNHKTFIIFKFSTFKENCKLKYHGIYTSIHIYPCQEVDFLLVNIWWR